jgi:hypothetical protein
MPKDQLKTAGTGHFLQEQPEPNHSGTGAAKELLQPDPTLQQVAVGDVDVTSSMLRVENSSNATREPLILV